MPLKAFLVTEASRRGFLRARFAAVSPALDLSNYDAFLSQGWHGEMIWLATGRDERADLERLLPGVRSVLVLAFDYTQALPPDPGGLTGRVASYAWGRDYHNFVLKRVRGIHSAIRQDPAQESRIAAIVAQMTLAQKIGQRRQREDRAINALAPEVRSNMKDDPFIQRPAVVAPDFITQLQPLGFSE